MNWIFCWGEKRARNFIETTTATKFCRWKFLVHTFIAIGCYTNALETHPYNDIVPCTDIHWEDWYQYVKCNFVSMCWASILYVKIVVAPNCPCIGSIGRISNEKWISTDKTNEWFLLEKNISACFSFRLKKPANGISSSYDCRVYAGYGIFFLHATNTMTMTESAKHSRNIVHFSTMIPLQLDSSTREIAFKAIW